MSLHRFYASPENITPTEITLDREETRHLRDVLRLRTGDEVRVFDGMGGEFLCSVESIGKQSTVLTRQKDIEPPAAESPLHLTLAAALTKGEKFDLVVQKAVELGVSKIVPLTTNRCDVKASTGGKRLDRWTKIALEAAKQCGRAKLMDIDRPTSFETFLLNRSSGGLLFSESGGDTLATETSYSDLTVVVGPEGGWDPDEVAAARNAGFLIVTLGSRILRAETASIAITAILQHRFGDLR